jgi:hypothetical protein
MALTLEPPPPETLTQIPTLPEPPKKHPDPTLTTHFPERRPYHCPGNLFTCLLSKKTKETYKCMASEVIDTLRVPFIWDNLGFFEFAGNNIGLNLPLEDFDAAVTMVIAAVECGYHHSCEPTPLDPRTWARLACTLTAAIGQGYNHQNTAANESTLERFEWKQQTQMPSSCNTPPSSTELQPWPCTQKCASAQT